MSLPDAGDFRVTLGDEEKQRIKRQIALDVEASLQVGTRELWHRLYEAIQHMADRLSAYKVTDDGVEHPFRDTVVTNLVRLVDVLPKLNITWRSRFGRRFSWIPKNCGNRIPHVRKPRRQLLKLPAGWPVTWLPVRLPGLALAGLGWPKLWK